MLPPWPHMGMFQDAPKHTREENIDEKVATGGEAGEEKARRGEAEAKLAEEEEVAMIRDRVLARDRVESNRLPALRPIW